MSVYTYNTVVQVAKNCNASVKKEYKLGISPRWAYYFAKAILNPKKNVPVFTFNQASNPNGTPISRQVPKKDVIDMANRLVKYVETNRALPNFISYKNMKIRVRLYCLMFANTLIYYAKNNKLPDVVNINYKAFTKPINSGNEVYDYFTEKTGKAFKTVDELLEYVRTHFKYEYYYDDHKSNKEVSDSKAGNCTDLLQWLCNMAEAMGYDWKCIHVKCKVSGAGHVFGKFKKKDSNAWFVRDIASVSDGGAIDSVWCRNGAVLAENPSWWLANLKR